MSFLFRFWLRRVCRLSGLIFRWKTLPQLPIFRERSWDFKSPFRILPLLSLPFKLLFKLSRSSTPVVTRLPSRSQESLQLPNRGKFVFELKRKERRKGPDSGRRASGKRVFVSAAGASWPCPAAVAGLARPQSLGEAAVGGTSVLAGFWTLPWLRPCRTLHCRSLCPSRVTSAWGR